MREDLNDQPNQGDSNDEDDEGDGSDNAVINDREARDPRFGRSIRPEGGENGSGNDCAVSGAHTVTRAAAAVE